LHSNGKSEKAKQRPQNAIAAKENVHRRPLTDRTEKGNPDAGESHFSGPFLSTWGLLVAKSPPRASAMNVEPASLLSDHIRIEQLELSAVIGVTDAERKQPQRLALSLSLWPRRAFVDLGDDIRNTINYSEVCEEVKTFARDRTDKLIETMADRLATHLLQRFAIQKVLVEIRKFVRPDAKFVSVTVSRVASEG
jgi:7,8-dihydroneopterin aldolase/epimerase/oxygenase